MLLKTFGKHVIKIIRIQRFIRKVYKFSQKKLISMRSFKQKLLGLFKGWQIRKILNHSELTPLGLQIKDMLKLMRDLKNENTPATSDYLLQLVKQLPAIVQKFHTNFNRMQNEDWTKYLKKPKKHELKKPTKFQKRTPEIQKKQIKPPSKLSTKTGKSNHNKKEYSGIPNEHNTPNNTNPVNQVNLSLQMNKNPFSSHSITSKKLTQNNPIISYGEEITPEKNTKEKVENIDNENNSKPNNQSISSQKVN